MRLVLLAASLRGNGEGQEAGSCSSPHPIGCNPVCLPYIGFHPGSLRVSGGHLTCDPQLFKALSQREPGPPISPSVSLLYPNLTPFVPSSMSPSSRVSWPPGSVPPPPVSLPPLQLPGLQPSRLPGCHPWLPLCGSELAPPPVPPSARPLIRLWTQRLGVRHKAPGAKDRPQPSAPTEEPPVEGMGVGRPTRYVLHAEAWTRVPG